jgi:hypothetical protein
VACHNDRETGPCDGPDPEDIEIIVCIKPPIRYKTKPDNTVSNEEEIHEAYRGQKLSRIRVEITRTEV